jgi:predicted nucleotidyltransferase
VETELLRNRDAIVRICQEYGVRRLRLFGSAATGRFDGRTSDYDFLVEFQPNTPHAFDSYFGLKEALQAVLGREVDLVLSAAVRNPYFAAVAGAHSQELYAA